MTHTVSARIIKTDWPCANPIRMNLSLRSLLRPSSLFRAFWVLVAAFHLYLFARRLALGDWLETLSQVKLLLSLACAGYGVYISIRIDRALDRLVESPRKAFAFAMVLLLGHFALSHSEPTPNSIDQPPVIEIVLTLPLLFGLGFVAGAAFRNLRRSARQHRLLISRVARLSIPNVSSIILGPAQWRRPPPCVA